MLKGVNLGNWLVLEKWMSPELFAGTSAEDEVGLVEGLDEVVLRERLRTHRDSYVTDRDFAYLAGRGIELVRLPVPYFVFDDQPPFPGCVEYVDRAFTWAQRYGIRVLLDLHTVPDSQNGFDNGGICGVCKWHRDPAKVELALSVLERLARRYGGNSALWGIEVLNEPISPELWTLLDVPRRYPASDPERAAGSEAVPTDFLEGYYTEAYARIRSAAPDTTVVLHDGFRMPEWYDRLTPDRFSNIVVDTHMYVMMAGQRDLDGYLDYIEQTFGATLREATKHVPVLVGEWCVDTKAQVLQTLSRTERRTYLRAIADAHLRAFEPATAWSYWSYKMHADTADAEAWDLLRALELGYLPTTLEAGDGIHAR